LPGALVDNLTSAGGQLQIPPPKNTNPQTAVVQYLREGATGASGTVIEPYAIGAKFPNAFLHVHYARGCSLVEAFYLSVQAPYQLLIVGDPLCQPWAQSPQVKVDGLADSATMTGTVALRPTAAAPGGVKQFQAYIDGEHVASCQPNGELSIDTTKLANGWRRLRVVAIDDTPIAVQGQWTGLVEIKNEFGVVQITSPQGNRISSSQSLTVDVRASQEGETTVYHLGRKIGAVDQTTGQLRIAVKDCGRGPVLLEARQEGAAITVARPLVVQVD
jgi:hypothetical protein